MPAKSPKLMAMLGLTAGITVIVGSIAGGLALVSSGGKAANPDTNPQVVTTAASGQPTESAASTTPPASATPAVPPPVQPAASGTRTQALPGQPTPTTSPTPNRPSPSPTATRTRPPDD